MVRCPMCGHDFELLDDDNPMGTKTINEHFEATGCNDPTKFVTPAPTFEENPENQPEQDEELVEASE